MSAALDRRVTPWRDDLAAAHLRGALVADRYVEGDPAQVVTPSAPLREAPRNDARLASEALFGEPATVYETGDGWAWAQLVGDGYVGYLPSAALGPPTPAASHRVSALRTYLYPVPDLKSPPRGLLSINSLATIAAESGDFARTDAGEFIHAGHLTGVGDVATDFVATAERFVGTPYLWGGRTSLGLDCSALVQMALIAAGIACPRDSDMIEADIGEALPEGAVPDALARGDLVFWRGHVGMMVDRRWLLHANAHHMETVIEPFDRASARISAIAGPVTSVRRLVAGALKK